MPESNSPLAYPQCREFLDRLVDEGQLAIGPMPYGQAHKFRMQCYTLRRSERRRNCKIYDETSPRYNTSDWEAISLRVEHHPKSDARPEGWWVVGSADSNSLDEQFQLLDPKQLRNGDQSS